MKKDIIEYLVNLLTDNKLDEVEYKSLFFSIKLVKNKQSQNDILPKHIPDKEQNIQHENPAKNESDIALESPIKEKKIEEEKIPKDIFVIKAPIMGTFYRAPSPDATPYVREGDKIEKGDILCIIEAMKVMNEVESEVSGTIEKILVRNGDTIDANQPLFYIKI